MPHVLNPPLPTQGGAIPTVIHAVGFSFFVVEQCTIKIQQQLRSTSQSPNQTPVAQPSRKLQLPSSPARTDTSFRRVHVLRTFHISSFSFLAGMRRRSDGTAPPAEPTVAPPPPDSFCTMKSDIIFTSSSWAFLPRSSARSSLSFSCSCSCYMDLSCSAKAATTSSSMMVYLTPNYSRMFVHRRTC